MDKTFAAKIAATTILDKQKAIETLRRAVTSAKTNLGAAKRDVKYAEQGVGYAKGRKVGEYGATAESIAEHVTDQEERLVDAKAALPTFERKVTEAQAELDAAAAALPAVAESRFHFILKWFSGSSLAKAKDALELLDASLEHGSWLPGASRKVRAALGKANVAKKTIKTNDKYNAPKAESAIRFAVDYGSFSGLSKLTSEEAIAGLTGNALKYFINFKLLVITLDRLDATRPVPVFTSLGVSATLTATLKAFDAEKVSVAELVPEQVEYKGERGETLYKVIYKLVWPEGIKHNTSRYHSTNENLQCQACGHAIRNNYNWVPLVLWAKDGTPKSCWTGRDCCESLFGIKLTGELEIVGR